MKKHYVVLFLILATLFWAGNYMFGKYVVEEMSPLSMTFLRWLLGVLLLFPIAHWFERPDWKKVWGRWKILSVMAILGIVGYNFLLYEALRYTTPMNAALVNSMNPALIVVFAALLIKEKISIKNGLGLVISLFGVLLVLTNGQLMKIFNLEFNQGDLLMIAAILSWTFYSIIGRRLQDIPPISSTAVSVLLGLILLLPFILTEGLTVPHTNQAMAGILYMGIFPSVGAFIFWNLSIRKIGPSRAGIYLNLITVFTAILSLILGKPITFVQIIGGVLVFMGVYLTSSTAKGQQTINKSSL
jgi:drug/metabolite transporter (DMT)-like permease